MAQIPGSGTPARFDRKAILVNASVQPNPGSPDSADTASLLASGALDGSWTLDATRSSVTVKTKSVWGLAKITGTFDDLVGEASVSDGAVRAARLTVGTESINTHNTRRDVHLRSADFFDAEHHPRIEFALEQLTAGATASASGTLTVAGISKPVTLELATALTGSPDTPVVTLHTQLSVDRRDFGMTWNQLGMASTTNSLTVVAVFTRP
jgi:polyisoprenoid-binding protein YceI